ILACECRANGIRARPLGSLDACWRRLFYGRQNLFESELGLEDFVHGLRICLAAGLLHHLPDEPAEQTGLRFHGLNLSRITGDDLVHLPLDRASIADLLHPAGLDDLSRITALRPDDLKQILCDLARDFSV